ncbi:hypothetical protein L9F63_019701, partial [Diploptera punctata]
AMLFRRQYLEILGKNSCRINVPVDSELPLIEIPGIVDIIYSADECGEVVFIKFVDTNRRFDFLHPSRFQQSFSPLPHSRLLIRYCHAAIVICCCIFNAILTNDAALSPRPHFTLPAAECPVLYWKPYICIRD